MAGAGRQQRERALESARPRRRLDRVAQMPLARHQRQVTGVAQQFGQRHDPVVQIALVAGRAAESGAATSSIVPMPAMW